VTRISPAPPAPGSQPPERGPAGQQPGDGPAVFGLPGDPRLWARCANQIAERLADGRYPPGQWLPGIGKICADLGVTYRPVEQVLAELCAAGLVTRVQGRRYYAGTGSPPDCPPAPPARQPRPGGPPAPRQRDPLPGSLQEEYITLEDLRRMLRIGSGTAYKLVAEGSFPGAIRVGSKLIRIPASSARAYLESRLIAPLGQAQPAARPGPPAPPGTTAGGSQ
jgi:predicted DNA-binding transcriptional regulator AlpA